MEKMDTTKQEKWAEEFDVISEAAGDWCSCMEGDLYDAFPEQQEKVKSFIRSLLQAESDKMADAIEMSKEGWIEQAKAEERERLVEIIKQMRLDITQLLIKSDNPLVRGEIVSETTAYNRALREVLKVILNK